MAPCPSLRPWLAALALLASPLAAEEFLSDHHNLPARSAVTGVADDDVLNIRAAPDASSPVVGTLAPDAADVEVIDVSDDGAWALVPLREGIGWAAARFLRIEDADPTAIPFPLRCVGTEPFWGVELREDGGATYDRMDEGARELRYLGRAATHDGFVLAFDDGGQTRDFTVMRRECSDGMSDRPYGFAVINWNRGEEVLGGCCFLLPR